MKETDTKSDNELIENFWISLGGKPHDPADLWFYESSWDMLMPVVEKISNHIYETYIDNNGYKNVKVNETAFPRTFAMLDSEGRFMVRFNRMILFQDASLIKATYEAVVEFIKWYNTLNHGK